MLKEAKIRLFQSHRSANLKFSSGITGIIGDSLSGKTAILRAIKWVTENRPQGFRFFSDFAKKNESASTQLIFDDCRIKLSKTQSNAIYEIEENDQVQPFEKFGSGIPDIVKNKTNLSSLNFQNQLDAHFLITSSGGKIAKAISHITQADKIITWLQKITKDLSTLKANKKIIKKDIEEIDRKLTDFKGMRDLDTIISKIEKLQSKKEKIDRKHYEIENLLSQIEEVQDNIKVQKQYLQAKPLIKKIEGLEQQLKALRYQKELLLEAKQIQKDIIINNKAKSNNIKEYIKIIERNKFCPTCFGTIDRKIISRIKKEMEA